MTSAILDEDHIISLLTCSASPDAVNRLQAGAAQALVDVFDRKVTRENFLEMVGECLSLYGQAAKLHLVSNVKRAHEEYGVTDENIAQAMENLKAITDKQAATVIEVVKRLKECPDDKDAVH